MSRILDLSVFEEDTLDIKMPNGETIHVKKPTEELAIKLLSYQAKAKEIQGKKDFTEDDVNSLMDFLRTLVKEILSYNKDKITVDDQFLKNNEIGYNMWLAILNAYTEFMSEITSNPNSKSPRSQAKVRKVGK